MASDDAIGLALDTFHRACLGNPPADATDEEAAQNIALWRQVFADVSDEELGRATRAWLCKDTPWHPRAGELLALVPDQEEAAEACRALSRACPAAPVGDPDRMQNVDRHTLPGLSYAVTARHGHPDDIGHGIWCMHYRATRQMWRQIPPERRARWVPAQGGMRRVLTAEARRLLTARNLPQHAGGHDHGELPPPGRARALLAGPVDSEQLPTSKTPQAAQGPRRTLDDRRAAAMRRALERLSEAAEEAPDDSS